MDIIIDTYMAEYWEAIKKLEQIPGIGKKSAEIILAEIGLDMNQFPSAGHLASWAGVAPGNNESAGKRKKRENPQRKQDTDIDTRSSCEISL